MSSPGHSVQPSLVTNPPSARRDRRFAWLWVSDTLSVFGAEVTMLVLPLLAATWLNASASQMGALVAAEMLPFGLLSLPAGAIIDRCRKLPLLRVAAFGRAALLLVVPWLASQGWLRMEALYAVAFLLSCLAVFVDPAYQALLPQVVSSDALIEANARLGSTQSVAGIVAPGLAGWLVHILGAPVAIVVDVMAIGVAGLTLGRIRLREPRPQQGHGHGPRADVRSRVVRMGADIGEGLRLVWRDPVLRSACLLLGAWQWLKHAFVAVFVLYAVRELALTPSLIGLSTAAAGLGFCASTLVLERSTTRFGLGTTTLVGLLVTVLCWGVVALARDRGALAPAWVAVALAGEGFGAGLFCLTIVSLRQAITPPSCLARVVTSMRFLTISATPLGAWAGGWLAEAIGPRDTIACISIIGVIAVVGVGSRSAIGRVRSLPPGVVVGDR